MVVSNGAHGEGVQAAFAKVWLVLGCALCAWKAAVIAIAATSEPPPPLHRRPPHHNKYELCEGELLNEMEEADDQGEEGSVAVVGGPRGWRRRYRCSGSASGSFLPRN